MCAILSVCLTFEASEFNIKLFFLDRIFHKFEWWINNEKKTVHWNFCSRKSFITNVSSLLLCLFFISPRLHSIPVHFIVIFCNKTAAKHKMNFSRWMRKGLWGCDVQLIFCKIFKNHFAHPHHFRINPFKNSFDLIRATRFCPSYFCNLS